MEEKSCLTRIDIEDAVLSKFDLPSGKCFSDEAFLSEFSEFSENITDYKTNVAISTEIMLDARRILLSGTVPAVFYCDSAYTLDIFIKNAAFSSAAEFYGDVLGFIIMKKKGAERINFRLIGFENGEKRSRNYQKTLEEISVSFNEFLSFLSGLLPLYRKNTPKVKFPFDTLRDGQRELIKSVWDAIKTKTSLYAAAPTGIGKTSAVLYPAMKALETGKIEKIIYIAPKNTLKKQVENTVRLLQGENISAVTLTLDAKMRLCPKKEDECGFMQCEYGSGYRDRISEAIKNLANEKFIGKDELSDAGNKFTVCPFELALRMIKFSDIVICDYNYIFDPKVGLGSLKSKKTVLLCDESHNLPDRIRESFSESLSPCDFDVFFKSDSSLFRAITPHFSDIMAKFEQNRFDYSQKKQYFSKLCDKSVAEMCDTLLKKINYTLSLISPSTKAEEKKIKELTVKLRKYIYLSKIFDENFRTLKFQDGGIKLYPASVEKIVTDVKSSFNSCVFFSATLSPAEYYGTVLAKSDVDRYCDLPSPFCKDNIFVGLCDVDVSFSQRSLTAKKLCSIIRTAVNSKKSNYMVFVPSFEYLDFLLLEFRRENFGNTVIFQNRNMSYADREKFLSEFSKPRKDSLVAFAVLGGVFSEGIDLIGDMLSGEIIVGTGFPPPSVEKESECDFFNEKELDGKSISYTLCGFNKVLQAAGRLIRTETDRGFLILCDTRFLYEDMRDIFPDLWDGGRIIASENELKRLLDSFWN